MPQINHDIFVSWLEKHFDKIKIRGSQIQVNSIFHDSDKKMRLYINTDKGCFHDFRTENSGNLYQLVEYLENCSYDEAIEILGGNRQIHELENKVADLFRKKKNIPKSENLVELPPSTYPILDLTLDNPFRLRAEKYLRSRKIDNHNLMVCCAGLAYNRIVIPYYNKEKQLIYWNARCMGNAYQKYMFPKDITKPLYSLSWMDSDKAAITEGEFDSIVLTQVGLFSIAVGGKEINDKQKQELRKYNIVFAFDNDKAGKQSLYKQAKILAKDNGHRKISYCLCPDPIKDWNEFLILHGTDAIKEYIVKNEEAFDDIKFRMKYYKDF